MGPAWVGWSFAGLLGAVAGCYLARLVAALCGDGRAFSGTDVAHALMGAGMAAMFLPGGTPLPRTAWEVVFAAVAAWFAARSLPRRGGTRPAGGSRRDHVHHMVAGLAMVYMAAAMPAPGMSMHMAGMSAPASAVTGLVSTLPGWLLIGYFLGHATWSGVRLAELTTAGVPATAVPGQVGSVRCDGPAGCAQGPAGCVRGGALRVFLGAPELTRACEMAMGVGMTYMLVTML